MNTSDDRPVMVYDGGCSFCRRWVARWGRITGEAITFEPYQTAAERFPGVSREEFGKAVHLFEPGGRVSHGAEAVFRSFSAGGKKKWMLWGYQHIPGIRGVTEGAYRFIAGNRELIDWFDLRLLGEERVTYGLTRRVFLIGLSIIYFFAFASLWVQVDGLIGSNGISPAAMFMGQMKEAAIGQNMGMERYFLLPTLCWWSAGDGMLHFLCIGGMAAAVLMAIGVLPVVMAVVMWGLYLSLVQAGQQFLGFQWDSLLLEAGFLAIFLSPWKLWAGWRSGARPRGLMVFMVRWLVFRLMFLSGMVKIMSRDKTWRAWEALKYHYETQPIPTWTSWYMHHGPAWFLKASVGVTFFVELIVPFLVFGPRRVRGTAFWCIVVFQLLIAATGNFGFFNWLAIVLCIFLLDDGMLPGRAKRRGIVEADRVGWRWAGWVTTVVAGIIFVISAMDVARITGLRQEWPEAMSTAYRWAEPFRSINSYGLFAVMTTERPEVIVEGSNDGVEWKEYGFKWKAGDVMRRPAFCGPHMPRLDWQMWFAALGEYRDSPWFTNFVVRLLQGKKEVLRLLANDPFDGRPPRYIRAELFQYHFTTAEERRQNGAWWKRERVGLWFPAASLSAAQ